MKKKLKIIGMIPARYASTRFRGKVIADIVNKPMIQRVYEQTNKSTLLDELFVAVDDVRVYDCVKGFGGNVVMTNIGHESGTDRIAEAVENMDADIVVNIQGDQPLIDARMIEEAVQPMLDDPNVQMSTLKTKIGEEDYNDSTVVKVVVDENDNALYFSRSIIPFSRDNEKMDVYEHIGIYIYRKDFLLKISKLPQTYLEKIEMLEQLRVLEKGYKIKVIETKCKSIAGISVDTPEDLKKVVNLIKKEH
ncbi:MAG: 3-deoxy-manno-octulosonate cytidylyltransferase [Flavobacteriaceae bacterium]|nr:3-deoxy-manno-octulosonate cytidylyltransferase [Flavobacteriaceae bacterium]